MDRHTKIKRHKHIYHKSIFRITPLSAVILVVAGLLLFALGWVLYEPVYNIITGSSKPAQTEDHKLETTQPPQTADTPVQSPSDTIAPTVPTPSSSKINQTAVKAAYLPIEIVSDNENFSSALDTLKAKGFTSVMIDLKNPFGNVLYNSKSATALSLGTISETPFNAIDTVKLIKQKGLQPIARIYAFEDALSANRNINMAVHYDNTEWAWLDNDVNNGGKPWLNPYSDTAQNYIIELANEAADLGFTQIVLDGVQFPQGFGLELASYGTAAEDKTKSAVLSEFVTHIQASTKEKGSQLYIFADSTALESNASYLGGDAWEVCGNSPVIGVANETAAIKTFADNVKSKLTDTSTVIVMLDTNDESQIATLKTAGIENYILYNTNGIYK